MSRLPEFASSERQPLDQHRESEYSSFRLLFVILAISGAILLGGAAIAWGSLG